MSVSKTPPHHIKSRVNKRAEFSFELVHSDVWGPLFYAPPVSTSQGEEDEWLIYRVVPPDTLTKQSEDGVPSISFGSSIEHQPTVAPHESLTTPSASTRPPIIEVYSRRKETKETCPTPVPSPSDPSPRDPPPENLDIPIALRKVKEALSHPGWRDAMFEEIHALDENHTWDLVNLPKGKKAVGCKWVFAVNVNPDGSVTRLKARLVPKGYAQTYGVDCSDTFSPVAKLTSVRLFISLAASQHWPLHQLDIKNAFLHGDLQEEVYMDQPPSFVAQEEYEKVCYFKKSLYGLKQSPRAWFGKSSEVVREFGLKKSKSDHSVFYRHLSAGIILLVVYVDDIIITESDSTRILSVKSFLQTRFHIKKLGQLKNFFGIKVSRSRKGIFMSRRKYVLTLLAETGKLEAKPCSTPMFPNVHLVKDDGDPLDNPEKYKRLVGKLNYLTVTRANIAFAVSVVSQFMSAPTVKHWVDLEQILCYLKGGPGLGILYNNNGHSRIECFTDAEWTGSKIDRRSVTGYCVFVGGNLVSWRSKKQNVVSRSSAESEYRAMMQSACEIMWINHLLTEIGLKHDTTPAKLWCDNQAALHIASNPVYHE